MTKQAKWIWYYGDYEIFHGNMLNARREAYGEAYPAFIAYPTIHNNVAFERDFDFSEPTSFYVAANGMLQVRIDDEPQRARNGGYTLCAGKHTVKLCVCKVHGLPAAYVYGDKIVSDESWRVCDRTAEYAPVGCLPVYTEITDNVEIFPFCYEKKEPVQTRAIAGGTLYDFGKEMFGYLHVQGIKDEFDVYYGESEPEACDTDNAILQQRGIKDERAKLKQRAFRYVFIRSQTKAEKVWAEYEYLPLKDVGSFACNDKTVTEIFDLCAYTLHLNSREFFLDGIKRDRWVWGGDAYQSFMISPYLYFDRDIIKRTILCLLGSTPHRQHVNEINDYSFYTIISVYDYWFMTADNDFVAKVYAKVKSLYDFCVSRLDEEGFVCKRAGDWIFIDWADSLDKDGPHCAEQILLWQATRCMKKLAEICGKTCDGAVDEDELKRKIYARYYRESAGGFIDGFVSGKNAVNRHQNILALLYDFTDAEQSARIVEKVLLGKSVPQITTPYFKFFELLALCKNGRTDIAQKSIADYWGGMLKLGATSVWEEYDPNKSGNEHYVMYGEPYGKSLCHAWGSGPICFWGKYVAGVRPTTAGYETWEVCPEPGVYESFDATVPLPHGKVRVRYENGSVTVFTDCGGGTLMWRGKSYPLKAGEACTATA